MGTKTYNYFQASDGTLIPYKIKGKGNAIVFIHGLFGKADDFNQSIDIISKNHLCITYDQRGHGKSEAGSGFSVERFSQDLKEIIEYLSLDNVVLVGYSLGAFIIFDYVWRFGCKYLKKIILVDITPKLVNDSFWKHGLYRGEYINENLEIDLKMINDNYMKFASYFTYRNMTKYSGKSLSSKPSLLSKIITQLLIKNTIKNRKITFDLWKDMAFKDYRETLKKFEVPTAIFYADPGSLFSPLTATFMEEKIGKNAIIVPFSNASHALVFSHTSQFTEEVISFVK